METECKESTIQCPLQTGNGGPKGERWIQWVTDRLKEGDKEMTELKSKQEQILDEVSHLRLTINRWAGATLGIPAILSAVYLLMKIINHG